MKVNRNTCLSALTGFQTSLGRFCLLVGLLLWLSQSCLSGGLLPGNIWPNPTMELDANLDKVPDFWHPVGVVPPVAIWATNRFLNSSRTLQLNPAPSGSSLRSEWYSDIYPIAIPGNGTNSGANLTNRIIGGTNYQLRFNYAVDSTGPGDARLSVRFYTQTNIYLSQLDFSLPGTSNALVEMTRAVPTPKDAAKISLSFSSSNVFAWLDDVSMAIPPHRTPIRRAIAIAQVTNGAVVGITIYDQGFGYTASIPPSVRISEGGGTNATAHALVVDGSIQRIVMDDKGGGYTNGAVVTIAVPPEWPTLKLEVIRVKANLTLEPGRTYVLEGTTDFKSWTAMGAPFLATAESMTQVFDVIETGQFFRLHELP